MSIRVYKNINDAYQPRNIDLLSLAREQDHQPTSIKDTEIGKDIQPIKVDISPEGLRALLASKYPNQISTKTWNEQYETRFEYQEITSFRDRLSLDMYEKVESFHSADEITLSAKREALMESFKSIADEISSGYEDGTRIRYVEDEESEDGYRRLSKEEELAVLQQDFDDFVEERFGENRRMSTREVLDTLKVFGNVMMDISWLKYYEPEVIPEDFINGMLDESREYIAGLK